MIFWKGVDDMMREITKVKHDHGILSVKLPKTFIREHNLTRRDYVEFFTDKNGFLKLKPLKLGVKRGAEFTVDTDKKDR